MKKVKKWWQNRQREKILDRLVAVLSASDNVLEMHRRLYDIPHVYHVYTFSHDSLNNNCYITMSDGVRIWRDGETMYDAIVSAAFAAAHRALVIERII